MIVTATCQAVGFSLVDRQVVQLVDTPGFSDTTRPDLDVLKAIAGWLQTNKAEIAGVVHLHRIDERRFTSTHRLTFDIVRAMCGKHFYPHLVLCTTMWNKLHRDVVSEVTERESELVGADDLWNPLISRHAKYMPYTGDQASGPAIVQQLLERPATGKMELQLELRNPCDVEDTGACRVITAELRKKEERLQQERLEEEEEERELREQFRFEREALQRDEQKKQKERAEQGKKTTFTFNDREYSEATLSKEIGRKGIGTELIFNKEMPETPKGWTATTPPAETAPYSSQSSPDLLRSIPSDFGGWTDMLDFEEAANLYRVHVAEAKDIQEYQQVYNSFIHANPRCPNGMTPLDRAVNPRVREFLLSYGGRTTRIGSHGKRVLCNKQETLAQLALDDYYPRSAAFGKFLFEDHVDASSESFAQMRTELQKLHLLHYSENTGGALVSGFPNPWHKPT
ncbi:hypothetical protein B5807_05590 [Epicoccum nigrum]|uniref:G domain-containing protein n=1 Tax=Epicoccum nigrum TaxID=105696 RepID=A0A1Y2M064_EPING|nr:hypothetical protein B5807_05590 [Epicoccum nigrum]